MNNPKEWGSCGLCGAEGVRLYRPYGNFYRPEDNRCNHCVSEEMRGWYVPLIKDKDGQVWGYCAIPMEDIRLFYLLRENDASMKGWGLRNGNDEGWTDK